MSGDVSPDFGSSALGTLEHWENTYQKDLENFTEMGDVGEIWYGEGIQERLVRWMSEKSDIPRSASIIDVGCGNGILSLALREEGFTNLIGVDYSKYSIQLAQKISEKEGAKDLIFEECDILSPEEANKRHSLYDVCVDKGTYDAISLTNAKDPTNRKLYISHLHSIVKLRGRLIILSCNWTKRELEKHFSHGFELTNEISAPKFMFGGQTGQTVTMLVFTSNKIS